MPISMQSLGYRGGAFFGVDHSLAGFRDKRNREARDEDLLANMKVRNKYFAQVAAMDESVVEPPLKLQTMVADVSQRIQKVLDQVTAAQGQVDAGQTQSGFGATGTDKIDLSPLSERWNELVRSVNPYLTGPNQSLISDEDANQLKQMISNQLLAPLQKLKVSIAVRRGSPANVINYDVLFGNGSEAIENQIQDNYYLPVRYGPQRSGINMSLQAQPQQQQQQQQQQPDLMDFGAPTPPNLLQEEDERIQKQMEKQSRQVEPILPPMKPSLGPSPFEQAPAGSYAQPEAILGELKTKKKLGPERRPQEFQYEMSGQERAQEINREFEREAAQRQLEQETVLSETLEGLTQQIMQQELQVLQTLREQFPDTQGVVAESQTKLVKAIETTVKEAEIKYSQNVKRGKSNDNLADWFAKTLTDRLRKIKTGIYSKLDPETREMFFDNLRLSKKQGEEKASKKEAKRQMREDFGRIGEQSRQQLEPKPRKPDTEALQRLREEGFKELGNEKLMRLLGEVEDRNKAEFKKGKKEAAPYVERFEPTSPPKTAQQERTPPKTSAKDVMKRITELGKSSTSETPASAEKFKPSESPAAVAERQAVEAEQKREYQMEPDGSISNATKLRNMNEDEFAEAVNRNLNKDEIKRAINHYTRGRDVKVPSGAKKGELIQILRPLLEQPRVSGGPTREERAAAAQPQKASPKGATPETVPKQPQLTQTQIEDLRFQLSTLSRKEKEAQRQKELVRKAVDETQSEIRKLKYEKNLTETQQKKLRNLEEQNKQNLDRLGTRNRAVSDLQQEMEDIEKQLRASGNGKSGGSKGKTDYDGPMESFSNDLPSKRSRGKGSSGSAKRKDIMGYGQEYNDESNDLFNIPAPMQPKTELMQTENAHMPILTGNKGLPKIYGMEKKLKNLGFYKPGPFKPVGYF